MVITYDNNNGENMWLHGPVNVLGNLFVDRSELLGAGVLQDNEKYGVEIGGDITFYTTQHNNLTTYHVPFVLIGIYEPATASYTLKPIFWFNASDINTPYMLMSAPLFPKADNRYSLGKYTAKWSEVHSHKFVVNDLSDVMLSNGTTITQSSLLGNSPTGAYLPLSGGTMKGTLTFQPFADDRKWINFDQCDAYIKSAGQEGMILYGGGAELQIQLNTVIANCQIFASAFFETSDIRKKDIKSDISLDKCYDLIEKCQTVIYSLKDQTKELIGMIAQEIEEFFPEVVDTGKDGFKSLAYDRLVVICFKVLKDVIKRVEKLELQ